MKAVIKGSKFIYKCRLVRGLYLDRKARDECRQALDRLLAHKLFPRVPPNCVDIRFIKVSS